MGIIKEPKNVDLSTKSEPWTEAEVADFRKIVQAIKEKNRKKVKLLPAQPKKKSA